MALKEDLRIQNVSLPEDEKTKRESIEYFLQGAVYCWCKNRKDEWFSVRKLMGGVNDNWQGTPLQALFDKHKKRGKDDPHGAAAIDAGWMLKKVVDGDGRLFDTRVRGRTRQYRWDPKAQEKN